MIRYNTRLPLRACCVPKGVASKSSAPVTRCVQRRNERAKFNPIVMRGHLNVYVCTLARTHVPARCFEHVECGDVCALVCVHQVLTREHRRTICAVVRVYEGAFLHLTRFGYELVHLHKRACAR